jgi:hypothetical protein
MEWAIIAFLILGSIFYIWNIFTDDKDYRFISALLLIISTVIFTGLVSSYESRNTPTALDVYQGNTTLEITYRDSIPVDSVVVWKDEFKK